MKTLLLFIALLITTMLPGQNPDARFVRMVFNYADAIVLGTAPIDPNSRQILSQLL